MHPDRERIAGDPALTAALRAAYTGTGDPLDQLWWREHPGERAPSGAPDPALELRALREQAFRPDPVPGADRTAAALQGRIRSDREAAEAAVRSLPATPASAPLPLPPDASLRPDALESPGASRRLDGRARALVIAVPAALVIGLIAGLLIGPERRDAAPAAAPSPQALAVFARAARTADRPIDATLPEFVRGAEVRLLQPYPAIGTVAYGVRTTDGRVCLMTVVFGERTSAACTSTAAFAASGVSTVIVAMEDPTDGTGPRGEDEIDLRWAPSGWISITPVPFPSASTGLSTSPSPRETASADRDPAVILQTLAPVPTVL